MTIDINDILFQLCEDEKVLDDDCELIESGMMDSFAFIELLSILEDNGIIIHPTQIDRQMLSTPRKIKELISSYK